MARAHPPAPSASPSAARPTVRSASSTSTSTKPGRAGFVLYVGLHDDSPELDGQHAADLAEVAEALRDLARDLLPTAETFTALSLVPGTGGQDDVQNLRARLSALRPLEPPPGPEPGAGEGVPDAANA